MEEYRGEERRQNNQEFVNLLAEIKQQMQQYYQIKKVEEKNGSTIYALLQKDVEYIKKEISEIKSLVENKYVLMSDFTPVKNIVYGMVGLVLVAVIGGLLTLVLKK